MTISTRHTERRPRSAPPRVRVSGFTLTEVMVAAGLSTFILAGVLSAFLMLGRSSYAASGYSELEAQSRQALALFGDEARQALDVQWNSAQSITLTLPTATNATTLATYAYDSATRTFYRREGAADSSSPRRILLCNVAADFTFRRYKLEQSTTTDNTATSDLETKQIELSLRASRTGAITVASNQSALSARYILRNKRVSN